MSEEATTTSDRATSTRVLSYSEVSRALDCQAAWDFAYGGHLAGSALRPKQVAPLLSEGRAFGAAAAAYHVTGEGQAAMDAMDESLEADADRQREFGVHDQDSHDEMRLRLLVLLSHYIENAEPIEMEPITERRLLVPIPSRSGGRASSRYRLICYIDATTTDESGTWLVEFKLRRRLSSVEQIARQRQLRWYAWAYERETGEAVVGVKTIERWNEVPKQPRVLKSGKPSHAKDQLCTAEAYRAVCGELEGDPDPETVEALERRRWQQVVPVIFTQTELSAAGDELVSAGRLIHLLDSGGLTPLRNVKQSNCAGCAFRDICPEPENAVLVDSLYERKPPKRYREEAAG